MPDEPPPSDRDVIVSAMMILANAPHARESDRAVVADAYDRSPGVAIPTPAPSRQAAHVLADAILRAGRFHYLSPPPVELLRRRIEDLDLPLRVRNALVVHGRMKTFRDLVQTPLEDVTLIREIGLGSVVLIQRCVHDAGLRLGMSPTELPPE